MRARNRRDGRRGGKMGEQGQGPLDSEQGSLDHSAAATKNVPVGDLNVQTPEVQGPDAPPDGRSHETLSTRHRKMPPIGEDVILRTLVSNLLTLFVLFGGVYAWLTAYTDLLSPAVLPVLIALTAPIPLAWKVLPEDKVKGFQEYVLRLFCSTKLFWYGWPLIVILLIAGCFVGAVELTHDAEVPEVRIEVVGAQGGAKTYPLPGPGDRDRRLYRTSFIRPRRLNISGGDDRSEEIELWPWTCRRMRLPPSWQKRLILLRPSMVLKSNILDNAKTLRVWIQTEGEQWSDEVKDYKGGTVWIGKAPQAIPDRLNQKWRAAKISHTIIEEWSSPHRFSKDVPNLSASSKVTIQLVWPEGHPKAGLPFNEKQTLTSVPMPMRKEAYPQEVVMHGDDEE